MEKSDEPRVGASLSIDPEFTAALEKHAIQLDPDQTLKLQAYARLMWHWNEQLNLTRHTTWELFAGRDLRDCVQLASLLAAGEQVLDLGSGNGVPGIPLSILRPDVEVSLAESVKKRARVLNQIIAELDLPIPVYAARGEEILADFHFSTIVARAVGSITKFCRWVEPHWSNIERLLLVKGPKWVDERGEARHHGLLKGMQLRRVAVYPLGDNDNGEGVILQISRPAA